MDHRSGQKRAGGTLYPPIEPFDQRMMEVGDGHQIYVEQSGHLEGVPVLVLHGGPGGGCSPTMRRFFDPSHYRVVMFDQRGCGRSRPTAEVEANTTWHLIADIERLRDRLGIERFILFGGSWGATLALIYAITHPERVRALALRGVFLGSQAELEWFYGGGAARFFPEMWERFVAPIPEAERGDLIAAYHRRLFSGDRAEEARMGRLWANWENALASVQYDGVPGEAPSDYARTFARLENHYFTHRCFLDGDEWILRNRRMIEHLPAVIVQGRLDMICPPVSARRLAAGWGGADLHMVPMAGHALSEPGISQALVEAMDGFRTNFP
ncbi:prolyl aminopeptidase [Falsirhodobacter sp. 20TX0035]|uniref:prolyl aminopeptidase n=1 Tax=Falsirhodobacter sp. 20TX0035 TaxID=3022019 RepID=UPI00232FEFE8|nr:prolyl aminopeptidase [Falsirhodobacter sp. 20TX0035]MDB6452672.1 prolyl aminopeptidase [Falsirhodobacter sp. 20TX0035]